MNLLLDVGNSRAKWNYCPTARPQATQPLLLQATQAVTRFAPDEWPQLQSAMATPGVAAVFVSNVGGKEVESTLLARATELRLPMTILRNGLLACGLNRSAYQNPTQLGVDRSLVMIGGLQVSGDKNLCVVNCGTAVTVDFVNRKGAHLGGVICPGVYAQQEKVVEIAAAIEVDLSIQDLSIQNTVSWFSTSTRQAIQSGANYSIAGLVRSAYEDIGKVTEDGPWQLLVTGGGAPNIMPLLDKMALNVPDLLMVGLASVALQHL